MSRRLVVVVALLAALAAGCDWPMFGWGPDHLRLGADTSIAPGDLPTRMQAAWTASVPTGRAFSSSPTVANGVLYVGGNDGTLYAFDAAGSANCSGSPVTCAPLWTATTGGPISSSPAVVNGVVYVGSNDTKLYAFDARGITNCSGTTPKTCQPLWTGTTGALIISSPTVVNGVVYVSSFDLRLYAFDAAGVTGCSGAPKACAPLWTTSQIGGGQPSPTVVNGVVYVGDERRNIAAYDANGSTNCSSDTPKVCAPLWTAMDSGAVEGTIAVTYGRAYVPGGTLQVYDANGSTNCSGSPVTCTPLWTYATGGGVVASPAIAGGVVYEPDSNHELAAFDAAGVTNCSGAPATCTPLWTASIGTEDGVNTSSPAIANGVVYVGSAEGNLYAFDAAGVKNCSGAPVTCSPLWSVQTGGPVLSSPTVADGYVYVVANGLLQAFVDDTQSPRTTVLSPADGSVVSGPTTLLESASDNVSVNRVELHITGGTLDDALIGVATPNGHGGSFGWDTTSVPNGRYTLTSVAYDEVGNVGRSPGVTITVQN